jgi:hypothetical protein
MDRRRIFASRFGMLDLFFIGCIFRQFYAAFFVVLVGSSCRLRKRAQYRRGFVSVRYNRLKFLWVTLEIGSCLIVSRSLRSRETRRQARSDGSNV